MKNLILVLLFGLSLGLFGCPKGPSGDIPTDPNDSTVVDTTKDTIISPDTVIITK